MKKYSKKMLALLLGAIALQGSITAVSASAETISRISVSETSIFEEADSEFSEDEQTLQRKGGSQLKPSLNYGMNVEPIYTPPSSMAKGSYAIVITGKAKKLMKGEAQIAKPQNEEYADMCKQIDTALEDGPVLFCVGVTKKDAEKMASVLSNDYELDIVTKKGTIFVAVTNDKDAYIIKYGESVELGVTATGGYGTLSYQWYKDGKAVKGATAATYTAKEVGEYTCTVSDPIGFRNSSKGINVVSELSFTKLPDDIRIAEGGSGEMAVEISGGLAPYTYQWYKDGAEIADSNSASCTVTEAGRYNCKVTDSLGQSITGRYGTVYVVDKLALSADLSETVIMPASGVVLKVAANGGYGTYSYQWYRDGELIITTKGPSIGTTLAGSYYCIITDESGQSVQSRTCDVIEKLAVKSQPQSQTVANGKSATLSVAVTGGKAPYTYQWYKAGTAISGATSNAYTASVSGSYYCVVKDNSGQSIYTNTASVTIASAISITSQTQNYPVLSSNGTASLSVTASGGYGTLTYQWYKSGVLLNGATKSTYTATEEGSYYCTVKDSINQLKNTSNIIVVKKLTISSQSGSVSINSGSSTTLSVTAAGGRGTYKYQWYKSNGTAISGATSSKYTTSAAGTYYCKVTDQSNQTVYSTYKTVTVITYRITSQPQSGVIASDKGYKLSVTVTGGKTPYKYTWRKDGGYIGNTANLTAYEPGKYYCTIVDADGKSLTSDTVTLTKDYLRFTNTFPVYAAKEGNYYHLKASAAGGSGKYYYYYWQKMAAGTNEWVYTDCHDPELYVYAGTSKGDIYRCCVTCEHSYEPGYAYLWGPRVYIADPMKLTTSTSYGTSTGTLTVKGSDGLGPYTVRWYKRTYEEETQDKPEKLISSYSTSSIANIYYTVYKSSTTSGTFDYMYYYGWGLTTITTTNCDVYRCEITDATGTKVSAGKFYVYLSNFK